MCCDKTTVFHGFFTGSSGGGGTMDNGRRCFLLSFALFILLIHHNGLAGAQLSPFGGNALYVSNGSHILRIDRHTGGIHSIYIQRDGTIVGLAADIDDGYLFWSDVSRNQRAIYRSWLDGTGVKIILLDVQECKGLSVDWISNHVYWTDASKKTVEIANYDGSGRRLLASSGLEKPVGIVVDPIFKFVFWADQGTRKIERSALDGTDRRTLVADGLQRTSQLAISYPTRRLYWVDERKEEILSSDLETNNVVVEKDISKKTNGESVFGLVVIGNTAIFGISRPSRIESTYVQTQVPYWKEVARLPGGHQLFSLVAVMPSLQTPSAHPCGEANKGGCSHLCLPTRAMSYQCACPSFGGLALSVNGKNCEVPSELLFFTLKESGDVGFISLTGAQSPYLTLVGRSPQPSAVSYDPINQMVYWSDVSENAIYTVSLDGTDKNVFLNSSQGIGTVDGLTIDFLARQLYFTNMGQSAPGQDGSVYSWHQIEMISLDQENRKTVVTNIERPRGLDLDTRNGFLFYGDWGDKPMIVQSLLDGSNPKVILDKGLSNPNGLTFYNGRLYVADSNYNNRTSSPHLMLYDVSKGTWQQLKLSANVSLPMGLAVRGDTLYYTDWVSMDNINGYLKSYDLRFGVDNNVMLIGARPTGLHYSPLARRRQESHDDSCDKDVCSHQCVRVPSSPQKPFKCQCPDGTSKILSNNQATCERPSNFLMFADLNSLKMISLDPDSESNAHTIQYGHIRSNFVAVTYDESTDTIYWSDLAEKAIYSSPFNGIEPKVIFRSNQFIEGITVDSDRQRLFWTGYHTNGTGVLGRMNVQRGPHSYHEVKVGLHKPKAILFYAKKKLLFWTDFGGNNYPASVHKSRANGKHHKVIMQDGLFWPNALASQDNKLYIGDGFGKVFKMNFDGSERQELTFMSGSDVFGMAVFDKVLFYSDWYTNSVYMVDMITGDQETVATHLSRPTSIVIFHPTNLSKDNLCEEGKCSEICVPVPRSYHCTCKLGSKIAADGRSCIQLSSPWIRTEDIRCGDSCGKHSQCAQHVPRLEYSCVCKPGYYYFDGDCIACGEDMFKSSLGNEPCEACPFETSTKGATASSQCFCDKNNMLLVNNTCQVNLSQMTTEPTMTTESKEITTATKNLVTKEMEIDWFDKETTAKNQKMDVTADINSVQSVTTSKPDTFTKDMVTDSLTTQGQIKQTTPEDIEDIVDVTMVTKASISSVINNGGLPYFENCPHDSVITVTLPDDTNRYLYPVDWSAFDSYKNRLPMTSNYQVVDGAISLIWKGLGSEGLQTVVFQAEDNWKQKRTCQFQVQVNDITPPVFKSCPRDQLIKSELPREHVVWDRPVAIDNVGVINTPGSHDSNIGFPQGTTAVNYTAYDKAGNKAYCNFTVTIVKEKQCNLPSFKNGAFDCGHSWEKEQKCRVVCESGFVVNPIGFSNRKFNCQVPEDLKELNKKLKKQEPCLGKKKPMKVRQEFSLTFNGPCNPNDTLIISELSTAILEYLQGRDKCPFADCQFSNMTIMCGPSVKKRRFVQDKFTVKWNITIESTNKFSSGQVESILNDIKIELMKLISALTLIVQKQQYTAEPGSVRTKPSQLVCNEGEMVYQDGCVPCPIGSLLNTTVGMCMACPRGLYQSKESQIKCERCPEGFTRERGSVSPSECIVVPSIDEMSKFLIITACTFGFVFLCMVIFMYLQYQRQQKQARKSLTLANSSRYHMPNIYVAPPPVPKPKFFEARDYMGCHDYEDIDGAQTAKANFAAMYRIPTANDRRDSTSSFKPNGANGDLLFRTAPSPSLSARDSTVGVQSYRTSDDTLVPSSPLDSNKSFKVSNDGSLKSPMSTRNSTTGSFRSSPESPYRSPQFGRDSSSSYRTTPESPNKSPPFMYGAMATAMSYRPNPEPPYRSPKVTREPNSSFKTSPESPYRTTTFIRDLQTTRQPAVDLPVRSQTFRHNTESPYRSINDGNGFRSIADVQAESPYRSLNGHGGSSFRPPVDALYKRPPSPLSVSSSRVSNDSLYKGSITPKASPNASRARLEAMFNTPPPNRSMKSFTQNRCYEYD